MLAQRCCPPPLARTRLAELATRRVATPAQEIKADVVLADAGMLKELKPDARHLRALMPNVKKGTAGEVSCASLTPPCAGPCICRSTRPV